MPKTCAIDRIALRGSGQARFALGAGLATLLLLSACGMTDQQRKAVVSFGTSAEKLGKSAAGTTRSLRTEVVDSNKRYLALSPGVSRIVITPSMQRGRASCAKGGFEADFVRSDIEKIARGSEVVAEYGKLLNLLAADSQAAAIEAATSKLTSSIGGFNKAASAGITQDQITAIGRIVAGAGKLFAENRKARALRRIVDGTHPILDKIERAFSEAFRPRAPIATCATAVHRRMRTAATSNLRRIARSPTARAYAAESLWLASQRQASVVPRLDAAGKAGRRMLLAHLELRKAMRRQNFSFTELRNFGRAVGDLASAVADLIGKGG